MFEKARLKLTAWYLVIIMVVSAAFSVAMYHISANELNRLERIQRLRQENRLRLNFPRRVPVIDPEVIAEAKNRLKAILILINLGVVGFSAGAGYFLAGRTLRPIKQMVEEQGRFITDASHELRTPITSLKSELEVNLRNKSIDKNTRKILESNLEDVNNLQLLSDNLIRLAQYQKGNGVKIEEVSLEEISQAALKKISNLAKNKQITIKNQINNYNFEGDKQSLVELLVIFLDNAIKYSHKNRTVTMSSKSLDHSIMVEVKDEGIGIAQGDLPHLFDRFYRADKSRSKAGSKGYGLGLSIAKQIIDKHQGLVKVESKLGKGTAFSIQLPVKQLTAIAFS